MTNGQYMKTLWQPGQLVCEINGVTGSAAKTTDDFHGLALARALPAPPRSAGKRRTYGAQETAAMCSGCLSEFAAGQRWAPL